MALVGRDGSIDWCCLPRFDSPSIFGRILDARRGGFWQIEPVGEYRSHQLYIDKTNILQTIFQSDEGMGMVIDLMPTDEIDVRKHARPHPHPRIVRLMVCLAGRMSFRQVVRAAPDYGRGEPLRAE